MNGYDFDKTIYDGDCTVNFFIYMNLKRPYLILFFPWYLILFALYGLKILKKKKFKELLFFFIPWHKKNLDKLLEKFWNKNFKKIKPWYFEQKRDDDIVISASLKFIIEPIAKKLNFGTLIATEYDTKTGKISGENCYGEAKVRRFKEQFSDLVLEAFYSDSMSDKPMMLESKKGFLVEGNKLTDVTSQLK